MKTNILHIFAAGALMLGALSCSEEWTPPTTSEGALNLESLTVGTQDIEKVATVAPGRAEVALDDFIVLIKDGTGKTHLECSYGSKPEIVTLPVGDYTLYVKSHEVTPAEWEKPYFAGSADFSITNGKIAMIGEVTAFFKSIRVSVAFSDELLATFGDDVRVNVKAGAEGELDFAPTETRSGYFAYIDGSTTLVAELSGTIAGTFTTDRRDYTDVEPGKHYILTYGIKAGPTPPEQTGNVDTSGISLDLSVITENIDGNVEATEDILAPAEGDRPVEEPLEPQNPDDPNIPEDPTTPAAEFAPYNSPNLVLGQPITLTSAIAENFGNAIVKISCPKGMAHLEVNISTTSDEFRGILESMLPLTFDLAYPGENEEALAGLGLAVGDEVINQTSVDFDITSFISLLVPFAGEHTFTITATDNEGGKSSDFLKFNAQ